MSDAIIVFVTAGTEEEATRIAQTVVEERLVACANVVGAVRSIYRWQGRLADEAEWLLLLKTRRSRFAELEARIRALHGYEVPEIVAVELVEGSVPYLDWLQRET